jgi:UDP-3-O-[3-hydroxymyristoyl] glucosamine N-acyltransferase
LTFGELIDALGGELVQGSREFSVHGVNSSAQASSSDLTFAENDASIAEALASDAGAVVLRGCASETLRQFPKKNVIQAPQPRLWFARAAKLLKEAPAPTGVHPAALLGAQVELGENVSIGAGAVIGDSASIGAGTRIEAGAVVGEGVHIGKSCRIYPRAVLYSGTTLGNRVMVHAGAVLGADGFGYVRDAVTGAYTQFPQHGTLVIEDDVEIGANSTIDRGALKETRIRRGTKIDNLVHIGHNCDIGEDVILVALTGISGSSTVGKGAVIAGQVGIGEHAHIGPGVILGGQAGVLSGKTVTNEGLKPGTVLWGTPARPLKQVLREQGVLTRLAKGSRKSPDKTS